MQYASILSLFSKTKVHYSAAVSQVRINVVAIDNLRVSLLSSVTIWMFCTTGISSPIKPPQFRKKRFNQIPKVQNIGHDVT